MMNHTANHTALIINSMALSYLSLSLSLSLSPREWADGRTWEGIDISFLFLASVAHCLWSSGWDHIRPPFSPRNRLRTTMSSGSRRR